jgi:hypothetical protein
MINSNECRITIAKVICYSIIAFLGIATFESIVINGARLLLNTGIWVLNTGNSLLGRGEKKRTPVPLIPPALLPARAPQNPVLREPLPPLSPAEEQEFRQVFKMLATLDHWTLLLKKPALDAFQGRTKHLHPLQVLGFLFEVNSNQRDDGAVLIDRVFVGSAFMKDTLATFVHPLHARNTAKYIDSFAEKVGISPDAARGFLLQNPPDLEALIHYILATANC